MRKLTLLFAAVLMASTTLLAETIDNVHCLDANGEELTIDNVNVVTDASYLVTWGEAGKTTWYVVTDYVTLSQGADCQGDVRLILADLARLTANRGTSQAGIEVFGEGNSLTIYGQANQSGQLIANGGDNGSGIGGNRFFGTNITINGGNIKAVGGTNAAGIGGRDRGFGTITINGGTVTATGGRNAAGIGGGESDNGFNITINGGKITATGGEFAAGIGGGNKGSGSNITINGGTITATGGSNAAGIGSSDQVSGTITITITGGTITATGGRFAVGIGSGFSSPGSANLSIPASYRIKIGNNYIHHNGTDLVNILADKTNVYACPDNYFEERNAYMAAIHAAVEGIANETILAMAAQGIEDVFQAEGKIGDIDKTKQKVLADLEYVLSFYNSGQAAAFGEMAEPCDDCPAVKVWRDGTIVTLYAPDGVQFIKTQTAED